VASALDAEEVAALRERVRAEALEAGTREGRALAYREWTGRLDGVVRALEEGARQLLASRIELAAQVERQLPKILLVLTRKVIHQELTLSQTAAQTVIRGLSERLAGCDRPVVVRLGPEMAEALEGWRRSEDGARGLGPGVRVEPDPELGPGEWVLQTGDGFLDGRVESQLEEAWRLIAELPR
jgi:flagellar biosynthesis/type III secretory pathway protein FliH